MSKCVHQVLLKAIHKQPKESCTKWAALLDSHQAIEEHDTTADAFLFLTASTWAPHRTLKTPVGSTSRMAGSAVLPTGEFAFRVGQTLQDSVVGPSYHSLRYDFKPASVNTEAPGNLTFGIDGQVSVR